MAIDFWKQRLARIAKQFSQCEPVELVMIREVKPVSDAAHKSALAHIIDGITDEANRLGPMLNEPVSIEELARRHVCQSRIKQKMLDECLMFGIGDVKFGSVCFYAPSLGTIPRVDASRVWQTLDEMFDAAGSVLEVVPASVKSQLSPLAMSFDCRKLRWAGCLFDIALRRLPGMTHVKPNGPHNGCWSATLKNVMAISVELVDWLIAAADKPVNKLNQLTNIAFDERERLDLMASGRLPGLAEYLRDIAPTVGLSRFANLANEVRVIARQRGLFPFPELDALATARDTMLVRCRDMLSCDGLRPLDASEFDDALVKLDSFKDAFDTSPASDMKAEANVEPPKPVEMETGTVDTSPEAGGQNQTTSKPDICRAIYEWAINAIPNADSMTILELHEAIQCHPNADSKLLEWLPDKPGTFGKNLKRAGIDRYDSTGTRKRRQSRRPQV